ncbi:hypothetical protein BDA96_03G122800 [Sorghum bicolor]|uniref:Uncharacterized protein n=2 Tax=Sorghum bicolor TaxID=4558 RepID=A0A921UMI0_SORBI|nr:hypothetical protein BDA96_03G122800 [Sorghum bicolor]KXG32201.1 hypothetical protein SORBI_3003G118000 [Sorghum bicolor]
MTTNLYRLYIYIRTSHIAEEGGAWRARPTARMAGRVGRALSLSQKKPRRSGGGCKRATNARTATATRSRAMRMFSSTGSRHTFPMICRGAQLQGRWQRLWSGLDACSLLL